MLSSVGGMLALISARRAKREGRKPYPTNPQDWLKFFIILGICILIGYLLAFR